MGISTTDRMTLDDVVDTKNATFVIDGEGEDAIKTSFESEQNQGGDLANEVEGSRGLTGLGAISDATVENSNPDQSTESRGCSHIIWR